MQSLDLLTRKTHNLSRVAQLVSSPDNNMKQHTKRAHAQSIISSHKEDSV